MKSRPASKSVGNRYDQAVVGLALSLFAVLSLWVMVSNDQQQALGAGLGSNANVLLVGTVPTEPTIPVTGTVPTEPTVPPTGTAPTVSPTATGATPTPTVTKTPVPSAHDKRLQLVGTPMSGNYCVATGGIGLTNESHGTFALTIDGDVVAAYLVWSGRYFGAGNGDDQIKIAINGGSHIVVAADVALEAFSGWTDRNHYTYRSENLINNNAISSALSGTVTVKALDLKSSGTEDNQGHGVGMIVVYANATGCAEAKVDLFYGLDGFHHRFGPPFGPNSEVLCVDVPAAATVQTLLFDLFVGGAEGNRPNAIWYTTGTGTKPTELISNSTGTFLAGSQLPGSPAPALTANKGQQWDVYSNHISVPAGHTFACLQIESVAPLDASSAVGLDVPADIIFDTVPYGTSGVWVSMVSRVVAGAVTPTATPTATTVVPTATSTPTPTKTVVDAPTLTPTATKTSTSVPTHTPTATTAVPTATQTATNVPTHTPTATPTGSPKPNLTFTITSHPSPPHPGMPLTFTIHFTNGTNGVVKQLTFTVIVPEFTGYRGNVARLQSAGWQCEAVTAGSECTYTAGDIAVNQSGTVDFLVDVSEDAPLDRAIKLNVVGTDAEGNAFTGGFSGVDHEVTVSAVKTYIPYVSKHWSK